MLFRSVTVGGSFTAQGNVFLGYVSNVSILGGTANQVLMTDGQGDLSWQSVSNLQDHFDGGTIHNALIISNTVASTSTVTGALVVGGGAGVGGNVYVGLNANIAGDLTANTVTAPQGLGTGAWWMTSNTIVGYTGTAPVTVDSWDATRYRSTVYVVQVSDTANLTFQSSQFIFLQRCAELLLELLPF